MTMSLNLLIAYDGSAPAREAITVAAKLFQPTARATVLYAWQPMTFYAGPLAMAATPFPEKEAERVERHARLLVEEAAQYAWARGLAAEGRAEEIGSAAWRTIVDIAERGGSDLIVMGARGLSGVRSLLMGSCSHHVAQHASCPVLIVPDEEIGSARRAISTRARVPTTSD